MLRAIPKLFHGKAKHVIRHFTSSAVKPFCFSQKTVTLFQLTACQRNTLNLAVNLPQENK
jgi:hypothetical protein